MALRIRLTRTGKTNQGLFRIGVFESTTQRDGDSKEILGTYNPREEDPEKKCELNEERVKYWLGVGAKPTEGVEPILKNEGLL